MRALGSSGGIQSTSQGFLGGNRSWSIEDAAACCWEHRPQESLYVQQNLSVTHWFGHSCLPFTRVAKGDHLTQVFLATLALGEEVTRPVRINLQISLIGGPSVLGKMRTMIVEGEGIF